MMALAARADKYPLLAAHTDIPLVWLGFAAVRTTSRAIVAALLTEWLAEVCRTLPRD
jgi:hypothetical protein